MQPEAKRPKREAASHAREGFQKQLNEKLPPSPQKVGKPEPKPLHYPYQLKKDAPFSPADCGPQFYPQGYQPKKWLQPGEMLPSTTNPGNVFQIPEVPTFYPTQEEFDNPLKYLEKIRSTGEKYGGVKIVPPKGWKPEFSLDPEFRFETRLQRLNHMNGRTRQSVTYMDSLMAYHAQQGEDMCKMPSIQRVPVDMWAVKRAVDFAGGIEVVEEEKKWGDVAHLAYTGDLPQPGWKPRNLWYWSSGLPGVLRGIYFKWIDPFEKCLAKAEHVVPGNSPTTSPGVEKQECQVCNQTMDKKVVCETCLVPFHVTCLDPPPKPDMEEFYCINCLKGILEGEHKGFEDGGVYTLSEFRWKANEFKRNYFKLPNRPNGTGVTEDEIEVEFWRMVEDPYKDIEIEYGADLHTSVHGSAFPTVKTRPESPYSRHPFNLNNLPVKNPSVLCCLDQNISGMMVPWLYVGHLFSTFCWHVEDHWAYAVNYLHFGDTKTWYIVPGHAMLKFEEIMRKTLPELFDINPDLLFHLTTMMSPEVLRLNNCPVYQANQREGEFVVTWPRVYHSGFNQGYNLAEAVNFAPPDWLPHGAASIDRLKEFHRTPVFSQEELIVRIVEQALREHYIHPMVKKWARQEFDNIIASETKRFDKLPQLERVDNLPVQFAESVTKQSKMGRRKLNGDGDSLVCNKCNGLAYLSLLVEDDYVYCVDCLSELKSPRLHVRFSVEKLQKMRKELVLLE